MNKRAGTYVQISRTDLENWLDTLPLAGKPYLLEGRAGIYMLPLSENVAVKLSSTIGSADEAKGMGQASMQLALVSRKVNKYGGPMVLNKKAQGVSHYKRTINWKTNWAEGIQVMKDTYLKAAGFYDAIAEIADRDQYKADLLKKIEALPNWQHDRMLSDFHATVERGGILTGKQAAMIGATPQVTPSQAKPAITPDQKSEEWLKSPMRARLVRLWQAAKAANNTFLIGEAGKPGFLASVGARLQNGEPLSPNQQQTLDRAFAQYKV